MPDVSHNAKNRQKNRKKSLSEMTGIFSHLLRYIKRKLTKNSGQRINNLLCSFQKLSALKLELYVSVSTILLKSCTFLDKSYKR